MSGVVVVIIDYAFGATTTSSTDGCSIREKVKNPLIFKPYIDIMDDEIFCKFASNSIVWKEDG